MAKRYIQNRGVHKHNNTICGAKWKYDPLLFSHMENEYLPKAQYRGQKDLYILQHMYLKYMTDPLQ